MRTDLYQQVNSQDTSVLFDREQTKSDGRYTNSSNLDSPSVAHSEVNIRCFIEDNINQGNYAVAISLIDELIARYPNSAMDYNNRGLMYFRNKQLSEAIKDLTHAIEIDPKLDSAYNNRANCYAAQGDLMTAVSDYDEALNLNPANLRAWINQGITFREMDYYNLALENFDIALIVGNRLKERIYGERGRTYHLRGDWNCAVADYKLTLELLHNHPNQKDYRLKIEKWLNNLIGSATS